MGARIPNLPLLQTCPACNGHGTMMRVEPDCCGNFTSHGECRGHCAVPRQVQDTCDYCGGHGRIFDRELEP